MKRELSNTICIILLVAIFQSCNRNSNNSLQTNSDTAKIVLLSSTTDNNVFDTLAVARGDLNLDSIDDLVIVFKKRGEDTIFNFVPKRPVKIFLGQKNNSHSLFCSSENVIMTHDMGGVSNPEPFKNISIKNGVLTVEHHGGMGLFHWKHSVNFKYSTVDKNLFVQKIEKQESKSSGEPSEALQKETIKTDKDFSQLTFQKYSVFDNEE